MVKIKIGNLEVYGIIYKVTNKVNGKVYIGQTIRGFDKRYNNNLKDNTHNEHIKNSIKKYGLKNFEVNKELDYAFSKIELNIKEQSWISIYKSDNNKYGYNKNSGGNNYVINEETRNKRKIISKRLWENEHYRQKILNNNINNKEIKLKKSIKMKGKNNPCYGKNPLINKSEQELITYRNKLSNMAKCRWKDNRINMLKNNIFYNGKNIWNEKTEVEKEIWRNKISISRKGKYIGNENPNYGHKWTVEMKKNTSNKMKGKYIGINNPNSKNVFMYNLKGELIFSGIMKQCCNKLLEYGYIKYSKYGMEIIRRHIKEKRLYKDCIIFSYKEMNLIDIESVINNTKKYIYNTRKKLKTNCKCIICINDNKVFISLREASKFYDISEKSIRNCCKNNIKLRIGKQFKYIKDLTKEEYIKYNIENKLKELKQVI